MVPSVVSAGTLEIAILLTEFDKSSSSSSSSSNDSSLNLPRFSRDSPFTSSSRTMYESGRRIDNDFKFNCFLKNSESE
ncbi:hypothetical protein WICMUC_000113 [Wickerhamomyces mucosus]|uniref:Uncharacterized protein n=1 Tax=Wickerhamomyces mucosus TaxID=1378264 RepID=A0A9P8PYA9_9ASCO|nr:hypothetical protein WICMUC_000113 [Wickerhamomyces mucosus]